MRESCPLRGQELFSVFSQGSRRVLQLPPQAKHASGLKWLISVVDVSVNFVSSLP